ncbi:contractile injection system tape measure protein [Sphingomonas sp. Root241]|uniref:contractile injection system tape measure protein n=1 Tax=Sphingomonas sp. Root241 TaxID=1736501 RepID=UPI0006FA84D5|nr:contractile injection system tape measure protein [Sphingomonas sp. Root241]KRC78972.1 hypothetical protein ASE13_16145 [Sphingomonas sp. Root241]
MRRVRLDHLVEEQVLTIHVERDLAQPALLNRLGEINRLRFVRVIEQVLDEFDTPGERVRIAAVQVRLGSFAPDDLYRAEARLRERLRAALAIALGKGSDGRALHEREGRALVAAFEHYLLHGAWPIGNAIALDTLPADLLGQLIAEDPLALVAMLRRRGSSDALLRRLVRQMPETLLAALLHRLEPVHAAYVLAYLGEVRERHAAERLIPASPAQLAEMLWTIVLRDALQESGLQANRKAFLLRLLRQLARSGGTTLAALIAQLRRGLPRMLARRRAPGSLVAVLGELIADEPGLLAGAFGISELAALLGRRTLSAREQREAARLVEVADPRQLRWLLRRLANEDPARLASAIEGVLPLGYALGAIWSIEVVGLPAAIEALAEGRAECAALLALAARSAERSEIAARLATALIARMRNSDSINLPTAKDLPARYTRSGTMARLLAAFTEAAEHPCPSDLARIRQMLATAMATDPLEARQVLRNFAAADPQRLCLLLGQPDAPDAVIGQLLAPHLHATLAALARAAHCSPAEWRALLDVAAGAADSDLPEMLLTKALEALARARGMTAITLRARLVGEGTAERETLTTRRLATRHAALEQFAFFWSGKHGMAPGEAAAILTRLLPHLSGLAPGMLRARLADENRHEASASLLRLRPLPRSALLRLALLLSGAKAELRAIPPETLPSAVATLLDQGNLTSFANDAHGPVQIGGDPNRNRAPPARENGDLRLAALIRVRPFTALRSIAETRDAPSRLMPLLADAQTLPLLFASMAPAERTRTEALARLLTGRAGRLAIAPAKLAKALAQAATMCDWRSHSGRGFAAEWLRQLFALASLAEQAALRRLLDRLPAEERIDEAKGVKPAEEQLQQDIAGKARAVLMLRPNAPLSAIRRALEDPRRRGRLARELSETELVELLLLLAPTAGASLLHAAERLAAARRAGGAPLARTVQWECILAASGHRHPIPRLTSLFLDGAEGVPPPPAPARARIEALLSASLEGMRDAPLRIALDLRERDRRRRAAETRPENSDAAFSAIHIANAGLVLASAFLPRLFQSLDYVVPVEDGAWRWNDGECRDRAVHLLQWLVDTRTDAPEPQLALNKLLCGVAVSKPISAGIILNDRELRMGGTLLATVLAGWPPLAESGIDALRQAFFRREGRLTRSEQGWSLDVETQVLDILLDQLPWGFSTILHPWMGAPLTVQWR